MPGSVVNRAFVEDQLSRLEADAAETLSDSSTMASSSGPAAESNQRRMANQDQLPASVLDDIVEDAARQFQGYHRRGHATENTADDAVKKRLISDESMTLINLLHATTRQRVEDQKKIRDLEEKFPLYTRPGTAINDLQAKLATSNKELKKSRRRTSIKNSRTRKRSF